MTNVLLYSNAVALMHIHIYIYICSIIRDNVTYESSKALGFLLSFYWIKVSQLRFIFVLCFIYIYIYEGSVVP